MKNSQLKTLQKLKESMKNEKEAKQTNDQLVDRIAKLESDLDHQKLLNKDLKREKLHFEQQSLTSAAKVEMLQDVLKMYNPSSARSRRSE